MAATRVVVNVTDLERCARTADEVGAGLHDDAIRLRQPFPTMPPDVAGYVVDQADLLAFELASAAWDLHALAADERRVARAAADSSPARWIELGLVSVSTMIELTHGMVERGLETLESRAQAARQSAALLEDEIGRLPRRMPRTDGAIDTEELRTIAAAIARQELGAAAKTKLDRLLALRGDVEKWAPSWCQSLINARRAELGGLLSDVDGVVRLRKAALEGARWLSPTSRALKVFGYVGVVGASAFDFYTFWNEHHHDVGASLVYSGVGLVGGLVVMWAATAVGGAVAAGAVISLPAIAVGAVVVVAGTVLVLGAQCVFKYAYEHGDLWNRDKGRFFRQAATDSVRLEDETAQRTHVPPVMAPLLPMNVVGLGAMVAHAEGWI